MNGSFTRDDISYWMMFLLLINRPVCLALGLPSMPIIIIGLLFFISVLFQDELFRYITTKKVIVAWGVLMLYHFINAKFCNVPETNFRVLLNCIQTTILLGFTVFNFILDEKRCLRTLIVGYVIFLVACLSIGSFTELNRLTSSGIHTNQIGQCAGSAFLHRRHSLQCHHQGGMGRQSQVRSLLPDALLLRILHAE